MPSTDQPGSNGPIYALTTLASGALVAGGIFDMSNGVTTKNVASWNGLLWSPLGAGVNNWVYSLAPLQGGDLLVGGAFTASGTLAASRVARWNGAAWSPLGTGVDNTVYALAQLPSGEIVAGGAFLNAGGSPASRIAKWNGTAWAPLGAGVNNLVYALVVLPNGDLIAGGTFTMAGGAPANRIARWNGSAWSPMGSGMNNFVEALTLSASGEPIAGGLFTTAGGAAASRIAKWTGSAWAALGGGTSADIYALTVLPNGDVVAGGLFGTAGGALANSVARWNGSNWFPMGTGTNNFVNALAAVPNGDVVSGGDFTVNNNVPVDHIARWRPGPGPASAPLITATPVSQVALAGSAVAFSVTATGTPAPTYQWRKNGVDIGGATTSTLSIPSMSPSDVAAYSCVVATPCATFVVGATVTIPGPIAVARAAPLDALFRLTNVHISCPVDLIVNGTLSTCTIEDATGAMSIFGPNQSIQAVLAAGAGTSGTGNVLAEINGRLHDYFGLFEMENVTSVVSGNSFETPTLTTVSASDFAEHSSTAEGLESRFVAVDDYVFSQTGMFVGGGMYTNNGITAWVRSNALAAQYNARFGGIPTGRHLRLTGVFSQYDTTLPSDGGYLIMPTTMAGCPTVSAPPNPGYACPSGGAQFSVSTAGNGPFAFRWQFESPPGGSDTFVDLSDGPLPASTGSAAVVSGAQTPVLTISLADSGAALRYRCRVSNGCGIDASAPAVLTVRPAGYANCDGSTSAPALNVADFTCFLQRFAAADPYANCDNSTVAPVLNVVDFTCYLQKFAVGCP